MTLDEVSGQCTMRELAHLELEGKLEVAEARIIEATRRASDAELRAKQAEAEVIRMRSECHALMEKAEEDVRAAKAAADEVKAAAEQALRQQREKTIDSQGPIFHALAERLVLSESFSEVVGQLSSAVSGTLALRVLGRVAEDFPDLDPSKYGYVALEGDKLTRCYIRTLLRGVRSSPLLKNLSEKRTLLTADDIKSCAADLDEEMMPILQALEAEDLKSSDDEESEGEGSGAGDEVPVDTHTVPATAAEADHDVVMTEADTSRQPTAEQEDVPASGDAGVKGV